MGDKYRERLEGLSCLMDGESASEEADGKLLDAVCENTALQDTWYRYHMIGDCLRHALPERVVATHGTDAIHVGGLRQTRQTSILEDTGAEDIGATADPSRAGSRRRAFSYPYPLRSPALYAIAASLSIVAVFLVSYRTSDLSPASPDNFATAVPSSEVAVLREAPVVPAEPADESGTVQFVDSGDEVPGVLSIDSNPGVAGAEAMNANARGHLQHYLLHYRRYAPSSGLTGSLPYKGIVVRSGEAH